MSAPLPPRDELKLAVLNAHPRDERIRFDAVEHRYFVDGCAYPTSVSGLIHDSFPQFDAPAVVNQYYERWKSDKNNKYAPLIAYLTGVVGLDDELAKLEIARTWSANGSRASNAGTDTHLQIELYLNEEPCVTTSSEFSQFQLWRSTHPTWEPYRTEWSVFDEDSLMCGQIDSLWRDVITGEYHMADWKRVASMDLKAFRDEKGFHPFESLPNTNHGHYTVQQNAYAYMLEKNYGIVVSSLSLVQVHPDLDEYNEWPLRDIRHLVKKAFDARADRVRAGEIKVLDDAALAAKRLKRAGDPEEVEASRKRSRALKARLHAIADALDE